MLARPHDGVDMDILVMYNIVLNMRCRSHHDDMSAAVQQAAAQLPEAGALLAAADAMQQRVAELLKQVQPGAP